MATTTNIGTLAVELQLDQFRFREQVKAAADEISAAEGQLSGAASQLESVDVAPTAGALGDAAKAAQQLGQATRSAVRGLTDVARQTGVLADDTERQADAHEAVAEHMRESSKATEELSDAVEGATSTHNDFNVELTLVSGTFVKWLKDMGAAVGRSSAFRAALSALANPVTAVGAGVAALALAVRELDKAIDETAERVRSDGLLPGIEERLAAVEDQYRLSGHAAEVFSQRLEEQAHAHSRASLAAAEAQAALEPLTRLVPSFGDVWQAMTTRVLESVPLLVAGLQQYLSIFYGFRLPVRAAADAVEDFLASARQGVQELRGQLQSQLQGRIAEVLVAEGDQVAGAWQQALDRLATITDDAEFVRQGRGLARSVNALLDPPDADDPPVARALQAVVVGLGQMRSAFVDAQAVYGSFVSATDRLEGKTLAYHDLLGASRAELERHAKATALAELATQEFGAELERLTEAERARLGLQTMADIERAKSLARSMRDLERNERASQRATQRRLRETADAWRTVGQAASAALSDMVFQASTARERLAALADILFDLLGAGLGGVLGGQGFRSGVAGFFGFPGRQHGGPVLPGRPYVVGEAGPEVVVPRSAGSVVPNDRLGGVTIETLVVQGVQDPHVVAAQVRSVLQQEWRADIRAGGG